MLDRRAFLNQLGAVSATGLLALTPRLTWWTRPLVDVFPEPDETATRALALKAVDAARDAGAQFADVRILVTRATSTGVWYRRGGDEASMLYPWVAFRTGYGIRAIVDGSWGFASGTDPNGDNVVQIARAAVEAARANRPLRPRTLELAPVPAAETGRWETPIQRDPFTVPLAEQGQLALDAALPLVKLPDIAKIETSIHWRRALSIFAATDGRVFTQRYTLAQPSVVLTASAGPAVMDQVELSLDTLTQGGYGYEAIRAPTLAAEMRQLGDRAIALAAAARTARSAEVGRYDLVLGPTAVGILLNTTIVPALNLPRALGYSADTGTSFAAPPEDMLGKRQVAVPGLTLSGDRTRPHGGVTAKWDEEGVETSAYTFVRDGTVVDYHTDRETAVELAGWYRGRGDPVWAHGCSRRGGDLAPSVQTPNVTLHPGRDAVTVDDLIAGTTRGLYVEMVDGSSDQQFLTGQYNTKHWHVREIQRGKLRGYVRDMGMQFMTSAFWRAVDGIGGPASHIVPVTTDVAEQLDPSQVFSTSTFDVVPLRVRNVNVLNLGRTA